MDTHRLEWKYWLLFADLTTWTIFPDHYGSTGLMQTTICEFGPVLSGNAAAAVRYEGLLCNPSGSCPRSTCILSDRLFLPLPLTHIVFYHDRRIPAEKHKLFLHLSLDCGSYCYLSCCRKSRVETSQRWRDQSFLCWTPERSSGLHGLFGWVDDVMTAGKYPATTQQQHFRVRLLERDLVVHNTKQSGSCER